MLAVDLDLFLIERKKLSKMAKKHLRKLKFCFLHPGLPLFQNLAYTKKNNKEEFTLPPTCFQMAGTPVIVTHSFKCMAKKEILS
jgi:hypothetical protein